MYLGLALITIGAGLLVHFGADLPVRDALGDALWAMMMFWLLGALVPRVGLVARSIAAYAICISVEASQLYHTPAIDAVRGTRLGHLALGSGFDPGDLLWYALGVAGAMSLELTARAVAES